MCIENHVETGTLSTEKNLSQTLSLYIQHIHYFILKLSNSAIFHVKEQKNAAAEYVIYGGGIPVVS